MTFWKRYICGLEPGELGLAWIRTTVMRIIQLKIFPVPVRLRYGSCKLIYDIISSFFYKFKNVVHSLESGETPRYSASHQAPNYVQRS